MKRHKAELKRINRKLKEINEAPMRQREFVLYSAAALCLIVVFSIAMSSSGFESLTGLAAAGNDTNTTYSVPENTTIVNETIINETVVVNETIINETIIINETLENETVVNETIVNETIIINETEEEPEEEIVEEESEYGIEEMPEEPESEYSISAAPGTPTVTINTTRENNDTTEDLYCWANSADGDGDDIDYYGSWYLDGADFVNEGLITIYDSGNKDRAYGVAADNSGNFYVTGDSYVPTYKDILTIKYNSSGQEVWSVATGNPTQHDTGYGITVDEQGNVYVAGYYYNKTGTEDADFYTIKYNSSGDEQWNRTVSYGNGGTAWAVEVDSSGNVHVAGSVDISGNDAYFVIKYNSTGGHIWNATYNPGVWSQGKDIALDSSGNVYVTGDIYNGTHTNYSTVKYNSSGNYLWNQTYDNGGWEYASGVATDSQDNVYVTGQIPGTTTNVYTIKYNSSGSQIWTKTYDMGATDSGKGITIDSQDNIYVGGYSSISGSVDYLVIKYNSSGDEQWNMTHDSGEDDYGYGVVVDNLGNVYITGYNDTGSAQDYYTVKYADEFNLSNQTQGTTVLVSTIDSNQTTVGDNWSCEVRAFDGGDYSNYASSANITIQPYTSGIIQNAVILDPSSNITIPKYGWFNITAQIYCNETSINNCSVTATLDPKKPEEPLNLNLGTSDYTTMAPANDACANAITISSDGIVTGETTTATADSAPSCITTDGTGGAVWYKVTGTGGVINASLCTATTNYDTKMRVYTGGCGGLTCVTGNDDWSSCSFSTLRSRVTWTSTLGTEYLILVHGYGTGTGNFGLDIAGLDVGGGGDTVDINSIETDPASVYEGNSVQCTANVTANNTLSAVNFNITYANSTTHDLGNGTQSGDIWTSSSFTVTENGTHTCGVFATDNESINDTDTLNFEVYNLIEINNIYTDPISAFDGDDSILCLANVTGLNTISAVYFNITNPSSSVTELGNGTQGGDIWNSSSYNPTELGSHTCTVKAEDNESNNAVSSSSFSFYPLPKNCTAYWGFDCGAGPAETEDNTFNDCTNGDGSDESVEEMWMNASTVSSGDNVSITCLFDQYAEGDDDSGIYYYNGTGWRTLWNGDACTGDCFGNATATFIVDNYEGTHWVRCSIEYDALITNSCAACANSYCDNDDLPLNVLQGSSQLTVSNVQANQTGVSIGNNVTCSAAATSGNSTVTEVYFNITRPDSTIIQLGNGTQNGNTWTSSEFTVNQGGTWRCDAVAHDNKTNTSSAYAEFKEGDPGVIPMNTGTPFYTTSQNPTNGSYTSCLGSFAPGTYCNVTWLVKTTGDVGDTWQFFAYFEGSYEETNHINITIMQGPNEAPVMQSAFVNGTTHYNRSNDDLYCWANASDNEGSNVSYLGYWHVNGVQNKSFDTFPTEYVHETVVNVDILSSSETSDGNNWSCEVRAFDEENYSSYLMSQNMTIIPNQDPVMGTVVANTTSRENHSYEDIYCWANASDYENDNLIYNGLWHLNGTPNKTFSTSPTSYAAGIVVNVDVLDSSETKSYDNWSCQARAYDGFDYSNYIMSPNVTIAESPLELLSVVNTSTGNNYQQENLTCWAEASGQTGENITYTWHWEMDGSPLMALEWIKFNETENGEDFGRDIHVDSNGNVYVAGENAGNGGQFRTIKYDENGTQLWSADYNYNSLYSDGAYGVVADSSGNVYSVGRASTTSSYYYPYMRKYNSAGVYQWAKSEFTSSRNGVWYDAAVDSSDNVYAVGVLRRYTTSYINEHIIHKFNSAGTELMDKRINMESSSSRLYSIAVDSSGNIYAGGKEYVYGDNEGLLHKYNSAGVHQWNVSFDSAANREEFYDITVDSSGNIYAVGMSYFDGDLNAQDNYDVLLVKYDSSGNQVWNTTYDHSDYDAGHGIQVDGEGNIYVSGVSNNEGNYDYLIAKFDSSGNFVYSQFYDTGAGDSVKVDSGWSSVSSRRMGFEISGNDTFYIGSTSGGINGTKMAAMKFTQEYSQIRNASESLIELTKLDSTQTVPGKDMTCFMTACNDTGSCTQADGTLVPADGPVTCNSYRTQNTALSADLDCSYTTGFRILEDNVEIDCNGYEITGAYVNTTGNDNDGIVLSGSSGSTVKDCDLTGFYYGMFIENSPSVTIENVKINMSENGIYNHRFAGNLNVSSVEIYSAENNGLTIKSFVETENLTVEHSTFESSGNNEIQIRLLNDTRNFVFENNTFYDFNSAAIHSKNYMIFEDIIVKDNIVNKGGNNLAISFHNGDDSIYDGMLLRNLTITGNDINETYKGVNIMNYYVADDININNNIFNNSEWNAVNFMNKGDYLGNSTISDNYIYNSEWHALKINNANHGLHTEDMDGLDVKNNYFENCDWHSIHSTNQGAGFQENINISGNEFVNPGRAIHIQNDETIRYMYIDNNTIQHPNDAGIKFVNDDYSTAYDIEITDNWIANVYSLGDGKGIHFNNNNDDTSADSITISGNEIYNTTQLGIFFTNGAPSGGGPTAMSDADGITITDNIIRNVSSCGIRLADSCATNMFLPDDSIHPDSNISGNSIQEAAYGIYCNGCQGDSYILNNTIDASIQGIQLTNTDDTLIHNNIVTGAAGAGINLSADSDNNLIYNNYFENTNNVEGNGTNSWNISKTNGTNIVGKSFLGGNYWSNYAGVDNDGDYIGDTNLPWQGTASIANGGDYLPLTITTETGGGDGPSTPPPPECSDACTSGNTICSGNGIETCGNYDDDSCTEWGGYTACLANEICSGGVCECAESWTCTDWSDCSLIGLQTRTCTDSNACGTEVYKPIEEDICSLETCSDGIQNQREVDVDCGGPCSECEIDEILEIPEGPTVEQPAQPKMLSQSRAPEASKPIDSIGGCFESFFTEDVPELTLIDPEEIKKRISIPSGYEMIVEPFQLECSGGYYELMLSVPEGYGDIKPLRCRGDECSATQYVREEDFICGGSKVIERKEIREKDVITAEEIKPIEQKEISITNDNKFVKSGNAMIEFTGLIPPVMTAKIRSPTWSIQQPKSKGLAITGTPVIVSVDTRFDVKIPARITLPYLTSDEYDEETAAIYTSRKAESGIVWEIIGGEINKNEKTVSVDIDNIKDYLNGGDGMFTVISSVCENCLVSSFENVYQHEGSRNAVILVHGLDSSPATFNELLGDFVYNNQPWQIWTFGYSSNKPVDDTAKELANFLQMHSGEFDTVSIVGHSLGGIVTQIALRESYEARQEDSARYSFLNKVRRVIIVASPNEGSPGAEVYISLQKYLSSLSDSYSLFNADSDVIYQLAKGFDIPRTPGIKYYVIAGTKPMEFNLGLVKISTADLFDTGELNDGIVSTSSAQTIGGEPVDALCNDYWEIYADHSGIIDHPLARKFIEKILSESISADAQDEGLLGYNQYFRLAVEDCSANDYYVLVGKKIKEADICDPCNCGDGICGACENQLTCQSDCGFINERDVLGPMMIYILLLATFLVSAAYTTQKYLFQKWAGTGWVKSIIALLVIDTAINALYSANYNTHLWLAYFGIAFVAAYNIGLSLWVRHTGFHRVFTLKKLAAETAEAESVLSKFNQGTGRMLRKVGTPFRKAKEGIGRMFMKNFESKVDELNEELDKLNKLEKELGKGKK